MLLRITAGNMRSAVLNEQIYKFKTNIIMKTKSSILVVTKAFFILLVMCCFSCSNGKTNYETTSPVIKKTNNVIGVKIATIQALDYKTRDVYVYVIDSCEYVGYINAYRSDFLTHKGNCKYCAERSKK